jgi:hypothetical protein
VVVFQPFYWETVLFSSFLRFLESRFSQMESPKLNLFSADRRAEEKKKEVNEQSWQGSEKNILPHHHAVAALLSHVDLHYTFHTSLGIPCLHLGDR